MRIPLPENVTYDDRDRVTLPFPVVWHGNAVEMPDDTPKEQIATLEQALKAFDRTKPTAAETALEEAKGKATAARGRMDADKGKEKNANLDDVHARLLALEMAAGLLE